MQMNWIRASQTFDRPAKTALLLALACLLGRTSPAAEEGSRVADRSSPGQRAIPAAFASLLGQCDLAQPLFVKAQMENGSPRINFYALSEKEFDHSLEANTETDRQVASVSMTTTGLVVNVYAKPDSAKGDRDAEANTISKLSAARAVVSAVAYLHSLGYLREEFRIRIQSQSQPSAEHRVQIVGFPITPGGHKTIIVTKSHLRMIPGA